jgi:uncharacterized phiE125 gp8 family phage protein
MYDRLTLVTGPATKPVTLAQARAQLRVDDTVEDALITGLIDVATAQIDGPDGIGYAMEAQTWRLTLDVFPPVIRLPLRPVVSVSSITYVGNDSVTTTFPAESYRVVISGGVAVIEPVHGVSWPSTKDVIGAVNVTFVAGEGAPAALKQAVLMIIADLEQNRQAQAETELKPNMAVESILSRYRMGWASA